MMILIQTIFHIILNTISMPLGIFQNTIQLRPAKIIIKRNQNTACRSHVLIKVKRSHLTRYLGHAVSYALLLRQWYIFVDNSHGSVVLFKFDIPSRPCIFVWRVRPAFTWKCCGVMIKRRGIVLWLIYLTVHVVDVWLKVLRTAETLNLDWCHFVLFLAQMEIWKYECFCHNSYWNSG